MSCAGKSAIAVTLLVLLGCSGCGLRDPYNHASPSATAGNARTSTLAGGASAPTPTVEPSPGAGGASQRTLLEFAELYGNLTPQTAQRRLRRLEQLAAGPLAQQIAQQAAHADSWGLPAGSSMASEVVNLDLAPAHGDRQQAAVALKQRLRLADGRTEQPVTNLFIAWLVRTRGGWRVASFAPQQ
jgi:hypothetical protein